MAKKMMFTLGSIATIIAVPAIAISCGNISKTNELSPGKHSHGKKGHQKGDKLLTIPEYQKKINDIQATNQVWSDQVLKLMNFNGNMVTIDPTTKKPYTPKEILKKIRDFGKKQKINSDLVENFINDYYFRHQKSSPHSLIQEWQTYVKLTIEAYKRKIKIVKNKQEFEKKIKAIT